MKIKDTVKQFAEAAKAKANVDIDIDYCKKNGIKYKNHEVDATAMPLFNSKSNKAAFDFLTKDR